MTMTTPELVLLGTGGATPYAQRVNPSAVITDTDSTFLFDAGSGVCHRLAQAGIPIQAVDIVCLSHLHADHCVELPLFILSSFVAGRKEALRIVGPAGTRAHLELQMNSLYSYIAGLVTAVTDEPPCYEITELLSGTVAVTDRWQLSCAPVQHGVPTVAYRLDTADGSITISGDTEPCEELVQLAMNTDVLVHECPFPPEMGNVPGHTSPLDVGRIAKRAMVKSLVLTHLFEETVGREADMVADIRKNFSGACIVGEDLRRIAIPRSG